MALIKCPECGKEVSDKAEVCINCGYPLHQMDNQEDEEKSGIEKQNEENEFKENEFNKNNEQDKFKENQEIIEHIPSQQSSNKKSKKKITILIACILVILVVVAIVFCTNYKNKITDEKNEIYSNVRMSCKLVDCEIVNLNIIENTDDAYKDSSLKRRYDAEIELDGLSKLSDKEIYELFESIFRYCPQLTTDSFIKEKATTYDMSYNNDCTLDGYYKLYRNGSVVYNPGKEFEKTDDDYSTTDNDDYSNNYNEVTDSNTIINVWVCAQDIVTNNLKSPSSAKFCNVTEITVYSNGGNDYTVDGYVNSDNSFGANIRTDFIVTLTFTGEGYTNGSVTFL